VSVRNCREEADEEGEAAVAVHAVAELGKVAVVEQLLDQSMKLLLEALKRVAQELKPSGIVEYRYMLV
jgi:hypothetical protein